MAGDAGEAAMMLKEKLLLKDKTSSAIVAVSDIDRARRFYVDTLGLEPGAPSEDDMLALRTGGTRLIVYTSEFAGSNKANAVVWDGGGDFDAIVGQLREKCVTFEEYPETGMDIAGGVHRSGD